MNAKSLLSGLGVVVLAIILIPFAVLAVPQLVGASHSFVVLSGSMQPTFAAGDVVIVDSVSPGSIQDGDVITFTPPDGHQQAAAERITHRVVDVLERSDGRYFRTKGDANEEADRALVPAENVVGRVLFSIPKLGYVSQFAGSKTGIVLLVIVPAILLIVSEVYDLVAAGSQSGDEAGREERGGSEATEFEWQE